MSSLSQDRKGGALIDARGITVDFASGKRMVRAVAGVDLALAPGETLALLGESGSGKSVTLRALMRLLPPTAKIGGDIRVDDENVLALSPARLAAMRGRIISMVFQDPGLAFDPVYKVGEQIVEAIVKHEACSRSDARARALALFERVRIPSPNQRLDAYPHEMSGGMRQRAMLALALSCQPKILLADEPTTALDATVQIQVLLLLRELQRELGLGVIFVTHDIGVAVEVADRIAVMYAGRIVEQGSCHDVIRAPAHPYTRALLQSRAGDAMAKATRLPAIPGAPPDPAFPPPGCAFAPRCSEAVDACETAMPEETTVSASHRGRCIWLTRPAGARRASVDENLQHME